MKGIDLSKIGEMIPSPRLAQAFLEKMPLDKAEAVDLVLAVRDAFMNHRDVLKSAKKALYKLKQQGFTPADPGFGKEAPFYAQKPGNEEPEAFIGPLDGLGNRPVFVAMPQFPMGVDVGLGIISDEEGIVEFFFGRYSKKRMREFKDIFFQQVGGMVETSMPHVGTLLEKAYVQNADQPSEGVEGYLQLRPWILENVTLLDRSPVYDLLPPESADGEVMTESRIRKLLNHELTATWLIDPDDLKSLIEEIIKAQESPIFITEEQRSNRIQEIKEKGVRDLYPESKRLIMKQRLEETAYIFLKKEEEEYVRLAVAAALTLAEADTAMSINPFLKIFVERNLDSLLDWTGDEKGTTGSKLEPSSQIILP
jgi:hypothetical protein